ncbi:CoA-binding protein [Desulfuromonas acetoxidans]|uniref:CoA-binding n=1 Tax=Desulfuromonas acetoxidans (strain DSM 684 / 11070) TaxID=281689 RepID=Q1K3H7_DESA6|nr:CoA-binding protein [Desulfuromonas acetoxidans]EAT16997.1 CoA-binding [Desulfuromonas acetoxidans DSM 684]MBF0645712.1 CoA-binding protein [Desulfuromonas acetoxidans]NVD24002.1 CoA-binding protein [Desulfuromonas acetoxidans]NVE16299.1 CoA-binding protein [Desulfuromonas acetoxidans]
MDQIETFLSANHYAVAGASTNRDKYGNKVLRCYQQNNKQVTPINPRAETIEGLPCVSSVADLDDNVESLSIITPPKITTEVVKSAIVKGIKNIWMQPGAESDEAVALCKENGINVIADGSCLLVVLHYHEH